MTTKDKQKRSSRRTIAIDKDLHHKIKRKAVDDNTNVKTLVEETLRDKFDK